MDTDGDRLQTVIALLAALAVLRAWFSACEAALTEINDAVVHARAEEDKAWKPLDRLISQPSRMRRCFTMHRIFSALFIGILLNISKPGTGKKIWEPYMKNGDKTDNRPLTESEISRSGR